MTDEVTRADQKRAERLAEKPKETEKPKDGPSQFDRVLEESKSMGRTLPATQSGQKMATEQAARETQKREDRQKEDEGREDKGKEKGKDQGRGDKKSGTGDVEGRVAAKGPMKDGRGGGGGEGKGGFAGGEKRSAATTHARDAAKALLPGLHGKFAEKLQASIAKSVANPALSQAVLNQLVQYVRVGINRAGDKEMQLDLHEKVFRGLKLRVTSRDGKVEVHFIAANAESRSLFEKNKDAIRDALEKKGIVVEDIRVT
jgi:flagellar hook-length control protein FliK